MLTQAQVTGFRGEQLAAREYRKRGYQIISANFSIQAGEIDLIAYDPKTYLRFVEVKTRSPSAAFAPSEAVDERKQNNIIHAALAFLHAAPFEEEPPVRFDIAEVYLHDLRNAEINIIEDAFFDDSFRREVPPKKRMQTILKKIKKKTIPYFLPTDREK